MDSAASKRSLQFCYTQMVDRPLARKLSLQYFASLDPEHRIRSSMLKSPSRQVHLLLLHFCCLGSLPILTKLYIILDWSYH